MDNLRSEIDIIDKTMQNLFLERMQVVKKVALYKKENNLPILDLEREAEIIKKNVDKIDDLDLVELYEEFYKNVIEVSKKYQEQVIGE